MLVERKCVAVMCVLDSIAISSQAKFWSLGRAKVHGTTGGMGREVPGAGPWRMRSARYRLDKAQVSTGYV